MTIKHTPGPWVISKETRAGQFVTETHIRGKDRSHIALIGPCDIEANARLIALAPKMLEALTRIATSAHADTAPILRGIAADFIAELKIHNEGAGR